MKTSQQWWNDTKNDPKKLMEWLRKQYHGEVTAADRIEAYIGMASEDQQKTLRIIAGQERQHAEWVGELLAKRGEKPKRIKKEERYWDKTLGRITSFDDAAAVAAHAEKMRLERIQVIAGDESAPEDIRDVFAMILIDERWHERAFRKMASEKAYTDAVAAHREGLNAIGLITVAEAL